MSQVARAASELSRIKERTTAKFQHIHRNTSLIKPSGLTPSSIHFNADKEAGECGVFSLSLVGKTPSNELSFGPNNSPWIRQRLQRSGAHALHLSRTWHMTLQ